MRERDLERLFAQHAKPLLRFLIYRTGDTALSEDLLADTFEQALRARRRFNPSKASEKTWLYTIALNRLRNHVRHVAAGERTLERLHAGRPLPAMSDFERVEQHDALQRALSCLTPEERESIALRFGADLTIPQIAELTQEKLTTIEGRVYRALRKLKHDLDQR